MDFRYTPEEQSFRMEVRQFVEEEIPEVLKGMEEIHPPYTEMEMEVVRKIAKKGWLGAAYPKEYGGLGENEVPMTEYILLDELNRGRAPGISLTCTYLISIVGNTILNIASEELKHKFIPKLLNADIRFAINYSEPDAGNDVANIRTKAELQDNEYLVNGTKRFITCADTSDYLWSLVRTQKGSKRHKGLSILIIPTNSPGITIIPFEMMNKIQTCEVIMEDVHVPKENLVGEEGKGWWHLMEALARERMTMVNFKSVARPYYEFIQWLRTAEIGDERLKDDPVIRQAVAHQYLQIMGGNMMQLIAGARTKNKDYIPTIEASASKMWRAMQSWPKANLALDIMRSYGLLTEDNANAPMNGWWAAEYGWAGHELSGAGGLDLNRKIIAQQGLGLPRGSN